MGEGVTEAYPREEHSFALWLVLLAGLALVAPACGGSRANSGTTKGPPTIVRRDLSRITRAFVGWEGHREPPLRENHRCPGPAGGSPLASVGRVYNYLDGRIVQGQVTATVEFRSAGKSGALVASPVTFQATNCVRENLERYYRPRFHQGRVQVQVTPGLPGWLTDALDRPAWGYVVDITFSPRRRGARTSHTHVLDFEYQDLTNPHVVYELVVFQIGVIPRAIALRLIGATDAQGRTT
jgi:hypothetical protein